MPSSVLSRIRTSPPALSRLRTAVAVLFALDGFVFGSWAARVPDVNAATGAGCTALGIALLCLPRTGPARTATAPGPPPSWRCSVPSPGHRPRGGSAVSDRGALHLREQLHSHRRWPRSGGPASPRRRCWPQPGCWPRWSPVGAALQPAVAMGRGSDVRDLRLLEVG